MLTLGEIQKSKVSLPIIREALNQVEKMVQDIIRKKETVNQKSFVLFNAYFTILIGLVSASYVVFDKGYSGLFGFVFPLSSFFLVSLVFLLMSLRCGYFGTLGSRPGFWLTKDVIEGNENTLAIMLAYLTHTYENAITISVKSNETKIVMQHAGLYLSVFGVISSPLVALLWSVLTLGRFLSLLIVVLVVEAVGAYFLAKKA